MLVNNQSKGMSVQKSKLPAIVGQLNIALHVSVVLISLSIAFALFDNTLFAWHPMFMSVGYILFMTEGLISAVMFRHTDGPERVRAIWSHALMQGRALLCILIGFAVIYQNKQIFVGGHNSKEEGFDKINHCWVRNNKSHFMSTHAKLGLATLLLSLMAPLLGIISFKRLGIIQRFPEIWHPRLKWLHRKAGVVTWLLSLVTVELALTHPAVKKEIFTPIWQGGVGLIGVLLLVLLAKAQIKLKDDAVLPDDRSLAKAV